ncbi:hypothetical protein T4B_14044 [Trichinella pseudospiralis]|uniref:Uncharacterized protein n=1 Tax=Trichinella pseudospiralis TaxID=6337 RepID=A0A0V1E7W8_TRIPS|nr:hypothetical protein T4A_10841 [Trichinella pseudospiralis]KRZ04381.1 hypothetical protein T4B_14044 [Trichinella pseudospiralis]
MSDGHLYALSKFLTSSWDSLLFTVRSSQRQVCCGSIYADSIHRQSRTKPADSPRSGLLKVNRKRWSSPDILPIDLMSSTKNWMLCRVILRHADDFTRPRSTVAEPLL